MHPYRRVPYGFPVCPSSLTAEVRDRRANASAPEPRSRSAARLQAASARPRGTSGAVRHGTVRYGAVRYAGVRGRCNRTALSACSSVQRPRQSRVFGMRELVSITCGSAQVQWIQICSSSVRTSGIVSVPLTGGSRKQPCVPEDMQVQSLL